MGSGISKLTEEFKRARLKAALKKVRETEITSLQERVKDLSIIYRHSNQQLMKMEKQNEKLKNTNRT